MRHLFLLIFLLFGYMTNAQEVLQTSKKLKHNIAFDWGVGLGYRTTDLNSLSDRLFPNSDKNFTNGYINAEMYLGMQFYDKVSLTSNINTLINPSYISRNNNDYSLNGSNLLLSAGYHIINSNKIGISLHYGIGVDLNILYIKDTEVNPSSFDAAANTKSETTLTSDNLVHKVSARFDFLKNLNITDQKRKITNNIGIEAGYYFADNNRWSNSNFNRIGGPNIDNSGFFISLIMSQTRKKLGI